MFNQLMIGATLLVSGVASFFWVMWTVTDNKLNTALEQLKVRQFQVDTCRARLSTLAEDAADDREIDNLPDDDLRNVPDFWLLPSEPE